MITKVGYNVLNACATAFKYVPKVLWHGVARPTAKLTGTAARGIQGVADLGFGNTRRAMFIGVPTTVAAYKAHKTNSFKAAKNYVDPNNNSYRLQPGMLTNKIVRNY